MDDSKNLSGGANDGYDWGSITPKAGGQQSESAFTMTIEEIFTIGGETYAGGHIISGTIKHHDAIKISGGTKPPIGTLASLFKRSSGSTYRDQTFLSDLKTMRKRHPSADLDDVIAYEEDCERNGRLQRVKSAHEGEEIICLLSLGIHVKTQNSTDDVDYDDAFLIQPENIEVGQIITNPNGGHDYDPNIMSQTDNGDIGQQNESDFSMTVEEVFKEGVFTCVSGLIECGIIMAGDVVKTIGGTKQSIEMTVFDVVTATAREDDPPVAGEGEYAICLFKDINPEDLEIGQKITNVSRISPKG